ncbi:MAG: prepilin-type N-terminal cleavage/methylation domain-containing protein [Chitinivibrionales bacterium]|nr:prepilin-type N-terminal cleavage/methylation domain-containing protein [Chitinivibrionales bacterium]
MRNAHGLTFLELVLAITISAILMMGMSRTFIAFIKNNNTIKGDIVQQERIQRLNHFMEKDLREAGLNLPGNGIAIETNKGVKEATIKIFSNEQSKRTMLAAAATLPQDTIVQVTDDCQAQSGDWLCLHDLSSTDYFYIKEVRRHAAPDIDSLYITKQTINKTYSQNASEVYFADCVEYSLETDQYDNNKRSFIRWKNQRSFVFNCNNEVTSMEIVARDSNNAVLTGDFNRACLLTVNLQKPLNQATNKIVSSIAVAIRNFR